MVLSGTHRYKEKCITTVLYRPVWPVWSIANLHNILSEIMVFARGVQYSYQVVVIKNCSNTVRRILLVNCSDFNWRTLFFYELLVMNRSVIIRFYLNMTSGVSVSVGRHHSTSLSAWFKVISEWLVDSRINSKLKACVYCIH